jgi:hypothetical protein
MLVLTLHPIHFTVCFPIGVLLFSCGIGLRAGSGAPSDLVRALKPDSRPDLPRRATAAPVNVFSIIRFSDAGQPHAESQPQGQPTGVRKPAEKETAGDDARSRSNGYGDLKALLGVVGVPRAAS